MDGHSIVLDEAGTQFKNWNLHNYIQSSEKLSVRAERFSPVSDFLAFAVALIVHQNLRQEFVIKGPFGCYLVHTLLSISDMA